MSENKKSKQSAYEQQESKLSAQSVAFIKLLTQRGILGDAEIDDDICVCKAERPVWQ